MQRQPGRKDGETPEQWTRIQEIFYGALSQPASGRDRWLDNVCHGDSVLCAEVKSLLDSDHAAPEGFIEAGFRQAVVELAEEPPALAGRRIGHYRLIREIGSGGMGTVYLASRDDQQYESEVAIKLVRPGLETDFIFKRFRRERQILAHLEHPNITRLLDGGTTEDGVPYLVMEFIDGVWITQHAVENSLSVEERLRLFLPVCAGIAYAHRNLVVHRDLKPGNILVDRKGIPKLLDFGICKLLHCDPQEQTHTGGSGMLTPAYASPEQILGEPVTTVSDVYSLGAVLYELLTGALPHRIERCTPLELEKSICRDVVAPPSQAASADRVTARKLRGDLDNIVMRAMQKDPQRRYESVERLAEDLQRYLEHRPVVARPDRISYRVGKFVRRNRVTVALASLAGVLAVTGATVSIEEAREAERHFQDLRKLATVFVFDVEEAARDLPGSIPVRRLIAQTGLEYLNKLSRSSANDWELKRELASAYLRLGRVQGGGSASNLGDPAGALASFTSAGKLLDEIERHSPNNWKPAFDRMIVCYETGDVQGQIGQRKAAIESFQNGLRIAGSLPSSARTQVEINRFEGLLHLALARLRQQNGELEAAGVEVSAGVALLRRDAEAKPNDWEARFSLADAYGRMGSLEASRGLRRDALAKYRDQANVLEALCRERPNDTRGRRELMFAYSHIGDTLGNPDFDNLGDRPGAYDAYLKMTNTAKFLHDADRADARALSDYGIALLRLGIVAPSGGRLRQDTLKRSLETLQLASTHNPQSRMIGLSMSWAEYELASIAVDAEDRATALRDFQASITTAEKSLAASPEDSSLQRRLVLAVTGLAIFQARAGERTAALTTLGHALTMAERQGENSASQIGVARYGVARAWQAAGYVYAAISQVERGEQARQDWTTSRVWFQKALNEWRSLDLQKRILPIDRGEMTAVIKALASGDAR